MEKALPKTYCQCMSKSDTLSYSKKRKYDKFELRYEKRANKNARTILEKRRTSQNISTEETDERYETLPALREEVGTCSILAKKLEEENELEDRAWDDLVPECSYKWTQEDVAKWIRKLGFPQYQNAMRVNFVTGRKLIFLDANNLSKMGIKDFEHIKIITASVRELLKLKPERYDRSVVLPPREPLALFLEKKWKTGKKNDALTYHQFLRERGLHPNDP